MNIFIEHQGQYSVVWQYSDLKLCLTIILILEYPLRLPNRAGIVNYTGKKEIEMLRNKMRVIKI
jgi:hypothetical protein